MSFAVACTRIFSILALSYSLCFVARASGGALEPFPHGARVACYGDSITADGGWVTRVAAHYLKSFPERDVRFFNCGISGGGFDAAELYFDWILTARKPTHVVLAFGVNDSPGLKLAPDAQDVDAEQRRIEVAAADFRKRYAALVRRIQTLGVPVILRTVTPYNEKGKGDGAPERGRDAAHRRVAEEILAFARESGLPVIDDYAPLKACLDRGEDVFNGDRVHPNDRGQWRMAEAFLAAQDLKVAPWKPLGEEAASAGIAEWSRLARRMHSVYATEWLIVRDESLSLETKLAKVRKWMEDNPNVPEHSYMGTVCRDYLELRPKGDAVYDDLDALWPGRAREFFKNGRYEGPECEMLDSGLGTGGQLPVFDLGWYVAECPELVGEKGFAAAVMFRPLDMGSKLDIDQRRQGLLMAFGNGWNNGWRIYVPWARMTVEFQIGREGGPWTLASPTPLVRGEWNSVCVTWDRECGAVRLYVNGALAAENEYRGGFVSPPGGKVSFGGAEYGLGSLKMQLKDLSFSPAPWDESKVRKFTFGGEAGIKDFEEYARIRMTDGGQAQAAMDAFLSRNGLNPVVRSLALDWLACRADGGRADGPETLWRSADALVSSGNRAKARETLGQIAAHADATPYARHQAALAIARTHELDGDYEAAVAAFRKAATAEGMETHLKWLATEGEKRCMREAAGLPAFDEAATRRPPPPLPRPAFAFHVSPRGSDAGDGSPQKPFATLERARAAVNAKRGADGKLPPGGATVYLHDGTYAISETFSLSGADSGGEDSPVVYRAFPGETPILSGGVELKGSSPVTDEAVLRRLPEAARGKVRMFDLKASGVGTIEPPSAYGFMKPRAIIRNLYENGTEMTPARWPDAGYAPIGGVAKGSKTVFTFDRERLARWSGAKDMMLRGFWYYTWADNSMPVASIDAARGEIRLAESPAYGIRSGMPFYAYNVLEELDRPGEWHLDRKAAKVYFWPTVEKPGAEPIYTFGNLAKPFISLEGTCNVAFDGLVMEYSAGGAMKITGSTNVTVSGCTIRKIGGSAIGADKCAAIWIYGNSITDIGFTGIGASGGDRRTLEPSRINVENNEIARFSRHTVTYNPAVNLYGCAVRVAHNFIHHGPSSAIHIEGNDHEIEFNRVENVVLESDDQGGIDIFGNVSWRGNVVRYNIWKDFGTGRPDLWQCGIRLDDAISGFTIYGNRFKNCASGIFGGVQIHGGQFNTVDNNRFDGCRYGVSFSPWEKPYWERHLSKTRKEFCEEVDIRSPAYAAKYPELARLETAVNANTVSRNLFKGAERILFGLPDETETWDNRHASGEVPLLWEPLPPIEAIGRYPDARAVPFPSE
ncbi:MAG: right-handed parallel beta-helix repeat-containing protein [Kiritimatiellae bacterium]|nr:right-handed parallel beta-helix repeat-containing protein [Kiritimatiellia bacterium]